LLLYRDAAKRKLIPLEAPGNLEDPYLVTGHVATSIMFSCVYRLSLELLLYVKLCFSPAIAGAASPIASADTMMTECSPLVFLLSFDLTRTFADPHCIMYYSADITPLAPKCAAEM
jgi:hypothetical protein